jgi:hypothetical protein
MKINQHVLSFLSVMLWIAACDDDLKTVGLGTMPRSDQVSVSAGAVYLHDSNAQTLTFDSIYFGSKTQPVYLLGNFRDKDFGSLKGDYVCQFYYSSFPDYVNDSIKDDRIDSVHVKIYYTSWTGDSLALMEAAVYPVKQDANFAATPYRYTNIDLRKEFVAPGAKPWASKLYTSFDMTIPDSIRSTGYAPNITLDVTNGEIGGEKIGERFVKAWKETRDSLQSIVNFTKFFKGLYVTTLSGEGNLLNVYGTSLCFYYTKYVRGGSPTGTDTTYAAVTYFDTASDIRVSCQYKNDNEHLTAPNSDTTYIKSPAGVYTQYTLPIDSILKATEGRDINSVRFSVTSYPKDDRPYALNPPATLMLIRKDSLTSFFESARIIAAPMAYKAVYNNHVYDFADISAMVRQAGKEYKEAGKPAGKSNLEVVLVPVREGQISSAYGNISLYTAYEVIPSGVKLRKGKEFLKLDILSSQVASKK